jgi:hypothetical protein
MTKPMMFIGSSTTSLRVAKALAEELEGCVEVTVWNEGIFDLNRGVLEDLLKKLDEFDFAILVLAPDDMTESKGDTKQSPRDNVLFECGLFMGKLGRDRTFIVYDESIALKIPSDFAGVTLAPYSGHRIGENIQASVRKASRMISDAIKKIEFSQLIGEWKTRYRLSYGKDHPLVEDEIEIRQSRGKIFLISRNNPVNDNYIGYAELAMDRHLIGEWKSIKSSANACGAFLLTIHPTGNIMYGHFTGPDEHYRVVYCPWVLARKGNSEDTDKLLGRGEELLRESNRIIVSG